MDATKKFTRFRAKIFKALSDPVRLDILQFLQNGEQCVCKIVPHLEIPQPLTSRHLKILKDAGLVTARKDGNKRLYSITDPRIFKIINAVTPDLGHFLSSVIVEQLI